MSDCYLSWRTDAGLVDAGKVEAWEEVSRWLLAAPPGTDLRAIGLGLAADASIAEVDLAARLGQVLLFRGDYLPSPLQEGLEQLVYALIARRPGQNLLTTDPAPGDYEGRPNLLDWLGLRRAEWPKLDTPRLRLLLTLQGVLDTGPEDDPERLAKLIACLELLPDFPG